MNDHAQALPGIDNRVILDFSHNDSYGYTLHHNVQINRDQARELVTSLLDLLLRAQNPQPIQVTPFTRYTPPAPHEPISQADGHAATNVVTGGTYAKRS